MEIEVTVKKKVNAVYLKAECGVRYWDDAEVNGEQEAEDSPTIPFASPKNETWTPVIEIDSGRVVDWPEGTTASVHYKVCDAGRYSLLDADKADLITIDGYVPRIMSPKENGYGDYVIMDIGPDGLIADWQIRLEAFTGEDE